MKGRVLVVDDEECICTFLASALEEAGYTTDVAYNGKEALEKVNHDKPDLIILDLFMPVMDGVSFLLRFREHKNYEGVPVIVVTGCHKESEMRDLPIQSFFQKPVSLNMLLREVDRNCQLSAN